MVNFLHKEFYQNKDWYFRELSIGTEERFSEEDRYTQRIIKTIIESNCSRDYSDVLSKTKNWWVFYHLSDMRKSLLNWYDFDKNGNVLEVGGEFGALTEVFCERCKYVTVTESSLLRAEALCERYRDFENLTVYAGEIEDMQVTSWYSAFDYIILNHVLETKGYGYSEPGPYIDFMKSIAKYLKPDGKILVTVENRYGIRNFCGAREIHTGKPFDGINRYPNGSRGYSFQRQELISILKEAGIKEYKFYYPLPDSRLPQLIYSDNYMEKGNISERLSFYDTEKDTLLAVERCLYEDILDNQSLPFLANAFLVECTFYGTLAEVDYAVVSTDRGRANGFATVIYNKEIVKKKVLYNEGKENLMVIYNNAEELQKHGIKMIPHTLQEYSISMPFVKNLGFTDVLKKAVRSDQEKFICLIEEWYQCILNSSDLVKPEKNELSTECQIDFGPILETAYIDMVPANCFYIQEKLWFYDQEFTRKNFPAKYVLFRGLKYTYMSMWEMDQIFPLQYFKEKYRLVNLWEIFEKEEKNFINKIRNRKANHQFCEWEKVEEKPIYQRAYQLEQCGINYKKPKFMHQVQEVQLILLKSLLTVCEKYHLKYFAIYGTLLGTVRHKGIIPWDDDIDIALPRDDYNKLLEVAKKEFGDKYFLQSYQNDTECFFGGYAKLRDCNTTYIKMKEWGKNCNQGIALDIFPLDKCYLEEEKNRQAFKKILFVQRLIMAATYPVQDLSKDMSMEKWQLYKRHALKIQKKILYNWLERLFKSLNHFDAYGLTILARYQPQGLKIFRADDFSGSITADYEFLKISIPIGYQKVLEKCYGTNYMQFPSKIQSRIKGFIAVDTPYKEYQERFWNFEGKLKGKKLIYVGTGSLVDNFLYLYQDEYPPIFIAEDKNENTPEMQWGYKIKDMKEILSVPEDERMIIICSREIEKYEMILKHMGIQNYYIYVQDKWWLLEDIQYKIKPEV